MRRILRVWVPIILLALCLTLIYFRQWILTAKSISTLREYQRTDIRLLDRASQSIEEIASLQLALRVKLFGLHGADAEYMPPPASARPALPASVVRAMDRHSVRLMYYRNKGTSSEVQFEGNYDSLLRFLETTAADLPQIDGFQMDRSEKNQVKLTLTLPGVPV